MLTKPRSWACADVDSNSSASTIEQITARIISSCNSARRQKAHARRTERHRPPRLVERREGCLDGSARHAAAKRRADGRAHVALGLDAAAARAALVEKLRAGGGRQRLAAARAARAVEAFEPPLRDRQV